MQRKNILFALAALGMLIGGVAVANAATGLLDNSTASAGATCVDDDADDAAETAQPEADTDNVEEECGPDDDNGADDDAETEDAEEADDKK